VRPVDEGLLALGAGGIRDPQLVAHEREELHGAHPGVEDEGDVDVLRELLEQTPADARLAGPHLAGQLDEATVLAHTVDQVREGLAVARAHVQKPRVRRDGKRELAQTEMREVHGSPGACYPRSSIACRLDASAMNCAARGVCRPNFLTSRGEPAIPCQRWPFPQGTPRPSRSRGSGYWWWTTTPVFGRSGSRCSK